MKRVLALILAMLSMVSTALAGDWLYIANPNPNDRLHLRAEPYDGAKSLGKYYNGAPIERTGYFNSFGWVEVTVGLGNNRSGYMKADYLSHVKQPSAMPQYAAIQPVKAYQKPDGGSKTLTIAGGRLVSLVGFAEDWWHLLVHTGESEGDYTCFVPVNQQGLVPLKGSSSVNAYISNPDPTDRLHLRASPSTNARSLGKYYNGAIGTIKGFTEDGQWLKVDLYGRTGYMLTKFITVEGKTNNTWYGMPTVSTIRQTQCYQDVSLTGKSVHVAAGTSVEVLGLVNEKILHVQFNDKTGYMLWKDTSYTDPK